MKTNRYRQYIDENIKARRAGVPFGIEELYDCPRKRKYTGEILKRLKKEGVVVNLARGVYYKPKRSKFGLGVLPVDEKDMIEYVSRKYDGYPSGVYAYNLAGLTLQTARIIEISTPKPRKRLQLGNFEFIFKKAAYGYEQAKDNWNLLIMLDALTNPSGVPDSTFHDIQDFVVKKIGELDSNKAAKLAELSLNYPARTRQRLKSLTQSL